MLRRSGAPDQLQNGELISSFPTLYGFLATATLKDHGAVFYLVLVPRLAVLPRSNTHVDHRIRYISQSPFHAAAGRSYPHQ